MEVVDEPSVELMHLRIRGTFKSRTRWWLLHSALCNGPIDIGRTTVRH